MGLPHFGKSLISWSSKNQRTVTLSSTEAEFVALTDVTREVMWLQPIFKFLGYKKIESVTIIFEDNRPAIHLASNQQTKGRTKHFNVKVKFISELIEQKIFKIQKVNTAENCADTMTKPLGKVQFFKHREKYMSDLLSLREKMKVT